MPMGQLQKIIKLNVKTSEELWPYQVVDEIQKVMEEGQRDGKKGWETCSGGNTPAKDRNLVILFHVVRALNHLKSYCFNKADASEDNLTHAFTRLMMAVAIERGYVKEDKDA